MISVDEARAKLLDGVAPLPAEQAPLTEAAGRITARAVTAGLTQPPRAASAMDGYAVRFEDAKSQGAQLKVIGEIAAGGHFARDIGPGEAVRIFTGGAAPESADHIVIQEQANRDGAVITVTAEQPRPAHIRAAGIDFREGVEVLPAYRLLNPFAIAVLAAANRNSVDVIRRPKVAIIANGDELVEPGADNTQDRIICSTPYGMSALLEKWGCEARYLGIAADKPDAIAAKIKAAAGADVIVPIGGASVGDYDYMKGAFADAGFAMQFEKISVKPGKPTWHARRARQYVLGLPGNPASALVCAHLFLKPLLFALLGLPPESTTQMRSAILSKALRANGPRVEYMRGVMGAGGDGTITAAPLDRQDSSLLTPFLTANCLIYRERNAPAAQAGDIVSVLPFDCVI